MVVNKKYTAALVVIGNEILSGRTQDKNINFLALKMVECGVRLMEVRIIPDIHDVIVSTLQNIKGQVDYVFTCGGIGPTHDDITAECVAKACGVELEQNKEAYDILLDHYGIDELTEARLRMARVPVGGRLIPNPVSAAPGFIVENIHVMAGVPRIMQSMMDYVASSLKGGAIIHSRTIPTDLRESVIAGMLSDLQKQFPSVDIGSYPHFKNDKLGVNVVLRSVDISLIDQVESILISELGKISI